ncbi:MAG: hypothetical protein MJE63_27700 [Proteobacteria bacterium]|nr:hypothetical protein [Pseudomonadota bacterium]
MEAHRQTCQVCGSRKMRNILLREPKMPDKVIVECTECKELVARYVIAKGGYYHHAKGYESYLRGLTRDGDFMNAKIMENEYLEIKDQCEKEHGEVSEYLKKAGKED